MKHTLRNRLAAFGAAGALALAMAPMAAMGLTADNEISVTGIADDNATVKAYLVVKEDQSNTLTDGTGGWALNGTYGDLKLSDILGDNANGISASEAATIAKNVTGDSTTLTKDGDKYKATVTKPGLYIVLVEGTGATVYNPMFVGADYSTDSPNTIAADAKYSGSTAVAKSSTPTITKTFTDAKDQAVQAGDKVPFEIGTTVPYYPAPYYTNPSFVITDTIDTGLTFNQQEVVVKVGDSALTKDTDYKVAFSGQTMTITFTKSYLQTERAASDVKVTYEATVSDPAAFTANVTEMTNEAYITFTNNPDDTTDSDHVKTHHYTFGIDADLTGATTTGTKTKELEKVAVNANGDIEYVTADESFDNLSTDYSPLAGAVFQLTGKSNDGVDYSESFTTDNMGTISFNGLGEGTYTLKETSAPAGYQLDSTEHTVVIAAEFNNDGTLKSYTITIDETVCSNVSITNKNGEIIATDYETKINENKTALLKNVKNGLLPSTGGTGILFYLFVGAAIMALAVVLAKRYRKNSVTQA